MPSYGSDIDNQPLRWYNSRPIYLTLYLTGGLAVGAILTALLQGAGLAGILAGLLFHPGMFLRGFLWQPVTYVFLTPVGISLLLMLWCFYSWALELEKYLGRRQLLAICGVLVLAPVVGSLLLVLFGYPAVLGGGYFLTTGILVAFATLYPNMDYFFGLVSLKWFAVGSIVFGLLIFFSRQDWPGCFFILLNAAVAYAMVRHTQLDEGLKFDWRKFLPRKKPHLRVVPKPTSSAAPRTSSAPRSTSADDPEEEMNVLLDKIASSGLQSLTDAEKTRLETLRQRLLRGRS